MIRQPDLHLPRLNDGSYNSLRVESYAGIYEIAAHWYGDLKYKQLLSSIYQAPNTDGKSASSSKNIIEGQMTERNSIEALLYGAAILPQEGLPQTGISQFMKASGLSILRSPGHDWNIVLKNDRGSSGHRHPDALNMILFANGEEIFPGTVTPSYGHKSYNHWYKQSISHNTITLNQRKQRVFPRNKEIEFGIQGGMISASQSHASSRALQNDPHKLKDAKPIQLRRTVVMLPSCIVDITRSSTDIKGDSLKGSFPETIQDMALHVNGELTMEGEWEEHDQSLIDAERINKKNRAPMQGYDQIRDLRRAKINSTVKGRVHQRTGGKVDIWLSPAPEGSQVFQGKGLGLPKSIDQRMPMLIQRRVGDVHSFVSIYAPWKETKKVHDVEFHSGNALTVHHTKGKDRVLSLEKSGELSQGNMSLKGTLGVACDVNDGREILLLGKSLKVDDFQLILEEESAIWLKLNKEKVILMNLKQSLIKGRYKINTKEEWIEFALGSLAEAERGKQLLSGLPTSDKNQILFMDKDNDKDPDIMERWWNGKRCRFIDENDNMKLSDQLGDMVGDAMQIDIEGDGSYDGPADMNINWVDDNKDGQADLMCVAINPNSTQKEFWGESSHYMYFIDVDGDGVNHFINWENFHFHSWKHSGDCNFLPDYHGDSIFIKTHLPPWALTDCRLNWENPFAFFDYDDDGCTELSIRYLNHHTREGEIRTYPSKTSTVQMGWDLDNDSQRGRELSFDMSLGYRGDGLEYGKWKNSVEGQKAPTWALPYYKQSAYRKIDELIYTPHEHCFSEAMKEKWASVEFVFDEDGDDQRWERVEFYENGNPYEPRPLKGQINNSIVRNVQTDTLGDRGEWDRDYSGQGKLYIGPWDNKLHLYGAERGVWLFDDGEFFGSGSAPRGTSSKMAKSVKEVVQYTDTNKDGFMDFITYDYDGDEKVDMEVSLLEYAMQAPQLIDPALEKWQGMHEIFKDMAKDSWKEAQTLYRSAWKAGMVDEELHQLSFASSTWEKYLHGYWLKEQIFRRLYKYYQGDLENCKRLKKAYFTGNYEAMSILLESAQL
ncbi:MAG: heparinase II/III family protein [Planctomycetes bacterium]|nr:heparinase II/III family protein [Planctomycetota bacterium]